MRPAALIFDVFGTLVDWRSSITSALSKVLADKGIHLNPADLADEWRGEYDPVMAPVRSGDRPYTALDILHRENLETVLTRRDISDQFSDVEKADLARAWEKLDPWSDSRAGLQRLGNVGLIAPCSNGSIALMSRLARHTDFDWDCILGAEIGQNFKPHPDVYLASCAALQLPPSDVMMVACHNSDLLAARETGLMTAFFPRPLEHGDPAKSDLEAAADFDFVAEDIGDLATQLGV